MKECLVSYLDKPIEQMTIWTQSMQMFFNGYCNVLDLLSVQPGSREELMQTLHMALGSARNRKIVHDCGRLADVMWQTSRGLGQQEAPLQAVNICDTQVC